MSLWIFVIIVLVLLVLLFEPTQTRDSTMAMKVRIKKIKCPRCRQHFDPVASVITAAQCACNTPKCGLELVNLAKLGKKFKVANVIPIKHEKKVSLPKEDWEVLNYEVPLEIHVYSDHEKTVMCQDDTPYP